MKSTKVVGIDIGDYRIKVSYIVKGNVKKSFYEDVPDNAVKGGMIKFWDAMAIFLKDTFKSHGIRCKNVIFSVPVNGVYVRAVELPVMTIKQLELNLPFEFQDYISDNTDKYFYDYAVIEQGEKNMKLLAVACSRELINKYRNLAKNAKLNPIGLVPDVIGIQRILNRYNQLFSVPADKDYAILDMGDQSFKIHFYNHGVYDVTRSLEPGGYSFAQTISEITGTDVHIARITEEENVNDIQTHEKLVQLYESRAVEIMRALNFYSYSNTSNTIDTLYYFGGSGNIRKLVEILSETLNIPVRPLRDLAGILDEEIGLAFSLSPQSYGVALDPDEDVTALSEAEIAEARKQQDSFETADSSEKAEAYEDSISAVTESSDNESSGTVIPESFLNSKTQIHVPEGNDEELVRLDDSEPEETGQGAHSDTVGYSSEESTVEDTKEVNTDTLRAIEELTEQISKGNS
ncbi:type II secretion system protein GspL [Oribacterium sp. P6A1]|uniref:type II secretion system protein GspL n=1 Tax=Oribacterium sp. P6A1 TaxID=1410612 RepID=UPI000A9D00DD|nr:type II secretion system protein GspL [Oribacterium sp. P6A1]